MTKFGLLLNVTDEDIACNMEPTPPLPRSLIVARDQFHLNPQPMQQQQQQLNRKSICNIINAMDQEDIKPSNPCKSPKKRSRFDDQDIQEQEEELIDDEHQFNQHQADLIMNNSSPRSVSPRKLQKSPTRPSCQGRSSPSVGINIHSSNNNNSQYNFSPMNLDYVSSKLIKELDHTCPSPSPSSNSNSNNSHHHKISNLTCNNFENSEQEVADKDYWIDHVEEDDEDDEFDEEYNDYDGDDDFELDNQTHFQTHFDEMRKNQHHHNNSQSTKITIINNGSNPNQAKIKLSPPSASSTPSNSPKSHVGTPSRPFPTLDYKIKSEQVKQNQDGTYSCPYTTCNKTIKGNKGNLSSHLRWHRRLDAEAGEARGLNNLEEGEEEEFTTPLKPSQRGVQLRNQMIHYGLNLFRQDNQGKYLCFFEGCQLRMLTNFSRHISKHERKGDQIKEDLKPFLPKSSINTPRISSMHTPTSPPPSSSQSASSVHHPHLSSLQSTPFLISQSSQSTPNLSPLQDSFKPQKKKLTINTKVCSSPVSNGSGVQSPPILSPNFRNTPSSQSVSFLSTPPMDGNNGGFLYRKSSSTSKLDLLIQPHQHQQLINNINNHNNNNFDDHNDIYVPTSPNKRMLSYSSNSLPPWSPNQSFNLSNKSPMSAKEEIQWIYKKPATPTSSPSSPRVFNSVVPTTPPSSSNLICSAPSTPTSLMNISFQKLQCKPSKEDAVKSLVGLSNFTKF